MLLTTEQWDQTSDKLSLMGPALQFLANMCALKEAIRFTVNVHGTGQAEPVSECVFTTSLSHHKLQGFLDIISGIAARFTCLSLKMIHA